MKNVIKTNITFQNYKDCLFSEKPQMRKINLIRRRNHEIFTETVNKIALSANDDKINTLDFGHYKHKQMLFEENLEKYLNEENNEEYLNYLDKNYESLF